MDFSYFCFVDISLHSLNITRSTTLKDIAIYWLIRSLQPTNIFRIWISCTRNFTNEDAAERYRSPWHISPSNIIWTPDETPISNIYILQLDSSTSRRTCSETNIHEQPVSLRFVETYDPLTVPEAGYLRGEQKLTFWYEEFSLEAKGFLGQQGLIWPSSPHLWRYFRFRLHS